MLMISKLALYKYINGGGGEDKYNTETRESYREAYINHKELMHHMQPNNICMSKRTNELT